jgi:hypothetical protein
MTLTFLSPWFLLAGLAVAVPIVIHLLQRRREVILPFSMVRFVLLARKRSSRRLKLRRLLLLAVRMAAVLLPALILAQPVLRSPASPGPGEEAGYTVMIVDNSLSMAAREGGRSLFENLRVMAEDFALGTAEGELFALIPAARMGEAAPVGSWKMRPALLQELSRTEVLPDKGDFLRAFEEAHILLREAQRRPRRIVVLSDLARGSWSDFSYLSLRDTDPSVPVRILRVGREMEMSGGGVLALDVSGESRIAGERIEVTGQLLNLGPESAVKVDLWLDGEETDRKVIGIDPGSEGAATFFFEGLGEGSHRIEMRLREDDYAADDSRYAGLNLVSPVRVLLVDGDPGFTLIDSETFFVREALRPERLSPMDPLAVRLISVEELARADLDAFDVVILANVPAPPDGRAIADFVSRGGGFVVFWGDNCRAGEYARSLQSLLPARLGESETAATGSPFRVGAVDYEDAVLSVFRPPAGGTLSTAAFTRRAGVVEELQGSSVPARFADGQPWMIRGRAGDGEVLLFTSTADLAWSDMPTKPAFVPLLRRTILGLSGNLDPNRDAGIRVGEEKVFSGGPGPAPAAVAVTAPDGSVRRVEFKPSEEGWKARYRVAGQVGFYTYALADREEIFAVNAPSVESDLYRIGEGELRSRFQQVPLEVFSQEGGEDGAEFFQAGSRSLTRPLFITLFFLLLAEMLLAGPRLFPRRPSA